MNHKDSTNFILHAKSDQFYWEGNGQLSIKTFKNGKAHYKTNKGFFAVENERYLLLNEGAYTISIEEDHDVESFCIFFKDGLAEDVARTTNESSEKLLDYPHTYGDSIGFFEQSYERHPVLSMQLEFLKNNYSFYRSEPLWLDEQFHTVMRTILHIHMNTLKEVDSLSSQRFSTREELFRRLHTAHDYILAYYNRTLSLQEIARVAYLSPNHLLRNYPLLFRKTPHQHITDLRIAKAKQLLIKYELNITDIAFEVGYHTTVSFSKVFKKKTGLSPIQYRKKVILDKN